MKEINQKKSIKNNTISPAAVERDDDGMWTHPKLPVWCENTTIDDIKKWLNDQGLALYFETFFESACEEALQTYAAGIVDISLWEPTCSTPGSFLLTINDTEDGPIALFAYPKADAVTSVSH